MDSTRGASRGTDQEGALALGLDRVGALALLRRVDLWSEAVRLVWRTLPPGWWRRWPPRPAPSAEYLKFRAEAMLGGSGRGHLEGHELIGYLEWCRRFRRLG